MAARWSKKSSIFYTAAKNMVYFCMLAFASGLSSLSYGQSVTCLIVDGSQSQEELQKRVIHDQYPDFMNHAGQIEGTRCHYFDSWALLNSYMLNTLSGLSAGAPIVVIQLSHGGPGGTTISNSGEESSEVAMEVLNRMASTHPVFAVLTACYSGDLLLKKILNDTSTMANPVAANLCMASASGFNRGAEGGGQDLLHALKKFASPGVSAEEIFMRSDEGLISSAAWERMGISSYFRNTQLDSYRQVINTIHDLAPSMTNSISRASALPESLQAFTNPILEQIFNTFDSFLNEPITAQLLDFFESDLSSTIQHPLAESNSQAVVNASRKLLFMLRSLRADGHIPNQAELASLFVQFEESDEFKQFALLNDASPLSVGHWNDLPFSSTHEFTSSLGQFTNALNDLKILLPTENINDYLRSKSAGILQIHSKDELNQRLMVAEILGQIMRNQSDSDVHTNTPSPLMALFGFGRSHNSRLAPSSDPLDRLHRSACKNFIF